MIVLGPAIGPVPNFASCVESGAIRWCTVSWASGWSSTPAVEPMSRRVTNALPSPGGWAPHASGRPTAARTSAATSVAGGGAAWISSPKVLSKGSE